MNRIIKNAARFPFLMLGLDVIRKRELDQIRTLAIERKLDKYRKLAYTKDFSEHVDFSEFNVGIHEAVKLYTVTTSERVNALIEAVKYVTTNNINGALVECGVWKGGSIMAMALTLKELGAENRDLYLYDTFSGQSAPADVDVSVHGLKASEMFTISKSSEAAPGFLKKSPLAEVTENVFGTGYPKEKFRFIEGKVEDTIPDNIPEEIAILRLDTDWYESTKHELIHLFPILKPGGVLIIDDYGHWEGARKATDEYFTENNICAYLNRIDYSCRIVIKTE